MRRAASRMRRRTRLRTTALPTFFETTIPSAKAGFSPRRIRRANHRKVSRFERPALPLARTRRNARSPFKLPKARRENGRGSSASIRPSVCLESCVIRSLEPKSNQPKLGLLEAWALWCQTLTAFGATAFEHVLTTGGGGAGTESVRFRTLTAVWLPSTFHCCTPPRNARFSNEKWSEPRQINTPFGASPRSLARDDDSSKPQIRNLRATATEARG